MKLPKLTSNEGAERLSIRVRESTMKNLRLYQRCYSQQYKSEISLPVLIEEMLKGFMRDDKDFAKYVQGIEEGGEPTPAPGKAKEQAPSAKPAVSPTITE